jgi:hypothetical protein
MRLIDADVLLEPNADCEERETCDGCPINVLDCEDFEKVINAAPTVDPFHWIPVTERLPEAEDMYQPPEQRYLCQLEAYGERKFCVLSRLKGAVSPFWDWYGVAVRDHEVTAWMPLPEPYREERQ